MQAYGKSFSKVYNARWNQFTDMVAPKLEAFFAQNYPVPTTLLDLCCGTGRMVRYFAERGYKRYRYRPLRGHAEARTREQRRVHPR